MDYEELLRQTAEVWTPNYPRKVAASIDGYWGQVTVNNQEDLIRNLLSVNGEFPGYVSTYSFPLGHPTNNIRNLPKIDTLMIDFDVEFDKDEFNREEWERKLSALLTRVRMIANTLIENDVDKYWRASLSGYKGVHLYLDFPPIDYGLGTPEQYHNGMAAYTDVVVQSLQTECNMDSLEQFIDVSSGWDFSRLTRMPNTVHEKATEVFGEKRYCVPVSIRELSEVTVTLYQNITKSPRVIPENGFRFPRRNAKKIAERHIKTATKEIKQNLSASVKSQERFDHYVDEKVNDRIELEDVEFLLKRKPCIWAFHENEEMFSHGKQSHVMEMQSILAMASIGTPPDVMQEFFAKNTRYNEEYTENRIKEILSRDYGEFNCETILKEAETFCLRNDCKIYQQSSDLQQL